MSHLYDSSVPLPFPVLPLTIHKLDGGALTSAITAFIDTGADVTIVPASLLDEIADEEYYVARMRSHWGEPRLVSVYLVDLDVAGERLPAVEVIADEQGNDILLGRNTLNKLILLLDGMRSQTDLLTRRPLRL